MEKDLSKMSTSDLANGVIDGVKELDADYYSEYLDLLAGMLINEKDNAQKRAIAELLGTLTMYWEMENNL